jgi:hypothetical protein
MKWPASIISRELSYVQGIWWLRSSDRCIGSNVTALATNNEAVID